MDVGRRIAVASMLGAVRHYDLTMPQLEGILSVLPDARTTFLKKVKKSPGANCILGIATAATDSGYAPEEVAVVIERFLS